LAHFGLALLNSLLQLGNPTKVEVKAEDTVRGNLLWVLLVRVRYSKGHFFDERGLRVHKFLLVSRLLTVGKLKINSQVIFVLRDGLDGRDMERNVLSINR
jgi:hypothetical protein